jgi:hypothetical protein
MAGFSHTRLLPTLPVRICLYRLCPMSSGTKLAAVVFGQHVHPILILVIFSGVLWRAKFITGTPERKN